MKLTHHFVMAGLDPGDSAIFNLSRTFVTKHFAVGSE
jgi:hypothetical protein